MEADNGSIMPTLILPNRREFLGTGFAAAAFAMAAPAQANTTRWAFLSDTHVAEDPADEYRGFRPHDNLNKVVPQVLEAAPDGVLIDGDLARLAGLPGDYAALTKLLAPVATRFPLGMTVGNHDDRRNFTEAVSQHAGDRGQVRGKHVLVIEHPPVRFIMLDSLMQPNFTPGLLGKAQRTWLETYLAAASPVPTIVFVHHTLDDGDSSLLDAERMFRILQPRAYVKAVVYGHSHVYNFDSLDGLHLTNIPAVGYNFGDAQPVGWIETTLSAEGADFKLHAIGGNTAGDGKVTSLSWRG